MIVYDDLETILRLLLDTTPGPTSNEGSLPISVIIAVILSCVIAACLMATCLVLILACVCSRGKISKVIVG